MLGEFKTKVKNALIYLLSIIPKDNLGEKLRLKGSQADVTINVDDGDGAISIYYNVQNKEVGGWQEQRFEKSGVSAGWIMLNPNNRAFWVSMADGSNANSGDLINLSDWKDFISAFMFGTFPNAESRIGIGIGNTLPASALHLKGKIRVDDSSLTTVTSNTASAGTATLPTNPVMFLIINVNGTDYKIPLYGV